MGSNQAELVVVPLFAVGSLIQIWPVSQNLFYPTAR
jgi:hypothetical protein